MTKAAGKASVMHGLFQVAVARRDDAHVGLQWPPAADALEVAPVDADAPPLEAVAMRVFLLEPTGVFSLIGKIDRHADKS